MRNLLIIFFLLIHISSLYCQERDFLPPNIDSIEEEFKQLYPRRSGAYRLFGDMRLEIQHLSPLMYRYELNDRSQYTNIVYSSQRIEEIANVITNMELDSEYNIETRYIIAYSKFMNNLDFYELRPLLICPDTSIDNHEVSLEIVKESTDSIVDIPFFNTLSTGQSVYRTKFHLPFSDLAETTGFVFHINGESYPVELDLEARDLVLNYEFEEAIEEVRELEGSEGTIIIQ